MRIYVLEDDPNRIITLCRYFDRAEQRQSEEAGKSRLIEVQWSQTCTRLDEFKPPYDLILLDHDLGGRQMTRDEDCGMTFLKEIKTIAPGIKDALIILHSHNLAAAAQMKEFHPPAVLAPYNDIKFWTILNAAMRTPT